MSISKGYLRFGTETIKRNGGKIDIVFCMKKQKLLGCLASSRALGCATVISISVFVSGCWAFERFFFSQSKSHKKK